jgi:hypothetical protein
MRDNTQFINQIGICENHSHDRGHLGQKLPSQSFGFGGQSTSLVIAEPQTSVAELFAKNTVLFAQVLDHVKLALIHPSGDSDE